METIHDQDARIKRMLKPQTTERGTEYVPSQFTLRFVHGAKRFVFHTLTKQCISAELPEVCQAGEGYDSLIESYFLVPRNRDESAMYEGLSRMFRAFFSKKGIQNFVIMPTYGCNARCIYCYEEGAVPTVMTRETEMQVVRFILNNRRAEEPVFLNWFGGEPLLGVGTIDRITTALREAKVEYRSSMISNGSLITTEIIDKMLGLWKLTRIQISMDGAEVDYRKRKNYYVYRNEYRAVMETISRLSEAGIQVSVRCNVDEENWVNIPRFLEDMETGVKNKEKVFLYFYLLYQSRRAENSLAMQEKIIAAQSLIRIAGFRLAPPQEVGLSFRTNHCVADGDGVVITPDGSLYPCEHCPSESRFGNVWQGITDEAARHEFCRTDRIREKCRKCMFLPDCTGFSNCPIVDYDCQGTRRIIALDMLCRLIEEKEGDAEAERMPNC